MANLGLETLQDEQLVELLDNVVVEVLSRDPIVQHVAQKRVLDLNKKREAFMEVVKQEIHAAEAAYIESVRMDVRRSIVEDIEAGTLNIGKMVGSKKEAQIIVQVTKEESDKLRADLGRDANKCSFRVEYKASDRSLQCAYFAAGKDWDTHRTLPVTKEYALKIERAVLAAFDINL